MNIVERGVDPDTELRSEFNVWRRRAKHSRCGTIVDLVVEDVHHERRDGKYLAYWVCPTCSHAGKHSVYLSRREFPARLREYRHAVVNGFIRIRGD